MESALHIGFVGSDRFDSRSGRLISISLQALFPQLSLFPTSSLVMDADDDLFVSSKAGRLQITDRPTPCRLENSNIRKDIAFGHRHSSFD